jgi:hypothetical protein
MSILFDIYFMRLKVTPEKHEGSLWPPTHLHLLPYHPKAGNEFLMKYCTIDSA